MLIQTDYSYPVLRLGTDYLKLKEETNRIYIKNEIRRTKEVAKEISEKKSVLTSKGYTLFEKLRLLRIEIAKEENIPPYIVFSDKTLNDMCIKLPFTPEEMLAVTGVGQNKKEKYGERFSELILQVTGGDREGYSWTESNKVASNRVTISGTNTTKKKESSRSEKHEKEVQKEEFTFTKWMAERIQCEGNCTLSEFGGKLNQQINEKQMKRLTIVSVEKKLEEEGYIYCEHQLHTAIVVKEKGKKKGFFVIQRISQQGNPYDVLMMNERAQRWLLEKVAKE